MSSARFFAAFLTAGLLAGLATAQPPSAGALPPRIDELEKAGELLKEGKGDDAYKQILEAVKKYPALAPPRLILARMLHMFKAQQARAVLELAAAENPDHPEVYLTLAQLAVGEGRVTETILHGQKILELAAAPRWTADQKKLYNREARAALANAYEARGDWANARLHFAQWLDADPKNGQIRSRYAACIFRMDKPTAADEAFVEFQTAVKDDSTLLPALVMMARQYVAKGDNKKAAEFFDRAVKQEANNAKVHAAYADYLIQQENFDAAKIQAEAAARLDARNIDVQRIQGMVARCTRDYGTAIKIFSDILNGSPADVEASNQLALILASMSDDAQKKRALQYAEMNFRQFQNNLALATTYGYCLYRNGNLAEARQLLAKATLGGQSVSPDMVYFLVLTLADAKETKQDAAKLLKNALESKAFFFYRKEAKDLNDKLEKEVKDLPKAKS